MRAGGAKPLTWLLLRTLQWGQLGLRRREQPPALGLFQAPLPMDSAAETRGKQLSNSCLGTQPIAWKQAPCLFAAESLLEARRLGEPAAGASTTLLAPAWAWIPKAWLLCKSPTNGNALKVFCPLYYRGLHPGATRHPLLQQDAFRGLWSMVLELGQPNVPTSPQINSLGSRSRGREEMPKTVKEAVCVAGARK